jgi:hypothetical protein
METVNKINKKVKLKLVGLDGNAYNLLGAFSAVAKRQGWTREEINVVRTDAMSSDYSHLVSTLASYCK